MSKLSAAINRMSRDLDPKPVSYIRRLYYKVKDYIEDVWYDNKIRDVYLSWRWFFSNFWYYKKQLWEQRPWDIAYCNQLYADSIERMARNTLEHGYFVGHEKCGRQALYAAKLLRDLDYSDKTYTDKAIVYYNSLRTMVWEDSDRGYRQLSFPIIKPGLTDEKMQKLMKATYARLRKEEIDHRAFVYSYIAKKSQRWGD